MSKFRDVAQQIIKTGYWTIPIFLSSLVGIIIGIAAFQSDYLSSYYGYLALGTRKAEGQLLGFELAQLIAAAPQVLQIIFLYVLGSSENYNKMTIMQAVGYFFIWFFCFTFDHGTDVFFRANGMPFTQWVIAFIESIFINTIVSEIALVVCIGLAFQLFVPSLKMTVNLIIDIADMFVDAVSRIGVVLSNLLETGKRSVGGDEPSEVKINGIRR